MSAVKFEAETRLAPLEASGTNGQAASAENGQPVHQFQPGMGDHPLWQMYMEEMEALRQADIAEGNRLADLEIGQQMSYLLDINSASLAFRGNERIRRRILQASGVWLSAIAAEERIRGALNLIQRTRDEPSFPATQVFLINLLADISDYDIHPYSDEAARVYAAFPASVKRLGTQDCRIAVSAIAAGWIVVTANHRHFSQISGVQFEDWSR